MPRLGERLKPMKPMKHTRLEEEVFVLRHELATLRSTSDDLHQQHAAHFRQCGGGDNCRHFHNEAKKQAKHIEEQSLYIVYLEEQIRKTRCKFDKKMNAVRQSANMLDEELMRVRNQLAEIAERAQQIDQFQQQIDMLKVKIKRRDNIIEHYNAQHTDIMAIIQELQTRIATEVSQSTVTTQTSTTRITAEEPDDEPVSTFATTDPDNAKSQGEFETDLASEVEAEFEDASSTSFATLSLALKNKVNAYDL